jgi:hypothetical protein
MPPELAAGSTHYTRESDLWCLGVSLYVLITCARPADETGSAVRRNVPAIAGIRAEHREARELRAPGSALESSGACG